MFRARDRHSLTHCLMLLPVSAASLPDGEFMPVPEDELPEALQGLSIDEHGMLIDEKSGQAGGWVLSKEKMSTGRGPAGHSVTVTSCGAHTFNRSGHAIS